jgi:hypothetical protein
MRGSSVQFRQGACRGHTNGVHCINVSMLIRRQHKKSLGRLMDGQQPSKLFCIGSNPIRDEFFVSSLGYCEFFFALPMEYRQRSMDAITRVFGSIPYVGRTILSILYLKANSFLLHQEVMNGYKFQEGSQGIRQISQ